MTHLLRRTDVHEVIKKALRYWCTSAKTPKERATFICGALCIAEIYVLQEDSKKIIAEIAAALRNKVKDDHENNAQAITEALIERRLIKVA